MDFAQAGFYSSPMTSVQTLPPPAEPGTFLGFPLCLDISRLEADIAILGIPYGDPYGVAQVSNDQSRAPAAIRRESHGLTLGLDHWDLDLGGPLLDDRPVRVVDCGDVPADRDDLKAHYRTAETVARAIFDSGAALVTLGGDHGIPIPVFRALDNQGPITLVHIDAHLDWRDEVDGVREGYSSPIRRAAELEHVDRIFQIGLRAQGSARRGEVEDALAYGARLITASDLHRRGMTDVLNEIPDGGTYYLTIDADGVDPGIMPAVAAPAPGGVLYPQLHELIHGLAGKGRFIGMDIVEITPGRDLNGITCITAGQLILNFIGVTARAMRP